MNIKQIRIGLFLFALILLPPSAGFAFEVRVAPGAARIVPNQNSVVRVLYTGTNPGMQAFTSLSPQGRFETADGTVLGTVEKSLAITLVGGRGQTAETVTVQASIVAAALRADQSRIFYRRTFQPNVDLLAATSELALEIVPPSVGTFSLVRMELAFNQPDPESGTRPSSGGRITVPRNTRGLRAFATITYNGSGTLRGQWKVDGQVLDFVTRQLSPGTRVVVIQSPAVPDFPTYSTGLHRVEFEVLAPEPGFQQPVIFYFVTEERPEVPLGSLSLNVPLERAYVTLDPEAMPEFSWRPVREGLVYRFRMYSLDGRFFYDPRSPRTLENHEPLIIARTRHTSYTLTPFDLNRLVPETPHIWHVEAYDGNELVAASVYRMVFFSKQRSGTERDISSLEPKDPTLQ